MLGRRPSNVAEENAEDNNLNHRFKALLMRLWREIYSRNSGPDDGK